jgi:hypothetical protein
MSSFASYVKASENREMQGRRKKVEQVEREKNSVGSLYIE